MDSARPAKELMLQWHTKGNWTHRAYWGENLIDFGKDGTPERTRLGDLPARGKWMRLEVPVAKLKLAPGTEIDGWAFTQFDGTVYWDKAGIETETPQDGQLYDSLSAWLKAAARERQRAACPRTSRRSSCSRIDRSEARRRPSELKRVLHRARVREDRAKLIEPLAERSSSKSSAHRKKLEEQFPTTLVFREKAGEPKPAFLLKRGEYDQRGEKVERGVPAFLPPLPPGAPVNRLGLAQWLIAPNHPLTARVAVNRFWLQLFGTGIVKTAEDFGARASRPAIRSCSTGWPSRFARTAGTSNG